MKTGMLFIVSVVAMQIAFRAATATGQVVTSAPPGTLGMPPSSSSGVVNRNRVEPPALKAPLSPAASNQLAAGSSNKFILSNEFGMNTNFFHLRTNLVPTGAAAGTNRTRP